eukprot:TRINITY_DN39502_c0_g1_i1.p1 TRINITY_DN39502_c0_g1~~TRINITY_DN39502_c0_g1_i1.p1  ORF type:complete len:411 (+),score=121.57 TRINITY_DN39502_c0_g1_i1:31-1263(+)
MGEEAAQQIINAFVEGMVAGRPLPMHRPGNRTVSGSVQMDRGRTTLWIREASGQPSKVPLHEVAQISVGSENAAELRLALDDLCVTLLLEDEKTFFSFQFEDDEARDTFALVLGMLVDQRRAEVEEQEEEQAQPQAQAQAQAQAQQAVGRMPAPLPPVPGNHVYEVKDFWSPNWCSLCQTFLSGVKEQGRECQGCKQVVCHSCAAKGGQCPAARPAAQAAASSAAPPPPPPAGYPMGPSAVMAAASAPSARGVPAGLEDFTGGDSARSSSSQSKGKKELTDGQKLVKRFVQKMVKGRELKMLSTTGRCLNCLVTLDRDIRNLSIQLAGKKDAKQRFVALKSIEEICVGREVAEDIELPVDDFSVTLVLDEGQAIAFELDDEESRDTFALCMGMFVDGNRKDAEKRKKSKK